MRIPATTIAVRLATNTANEPKNQSRAALFPPFVPVSLA
jgi:hypothetical protein